MHNKQHVLNLLFSNHYASVAENMLCHQIMSIDRTSFGGSE